MVGAEMDKIKVDCFESHNYDIRTRSPALEQLSHYVQQSDSIFNVLTSAIICDS